MCVGTIVELFLAKHYDDTLQQELQEAPNSTSIVKNTKVSHENPVLSLLYNLIPFALILLIMFFFLNQMQGGGGRVMQFGKARAKLVSKDTPKTTFADVTLPAAMACSIPDSGTFL